MEMPDPERYNTNQSLAKMRFAYQVVKAKPQLSNLTCVDFTQLPPESWKEVGINPDGGAPHGVYIGTNLTLTGFACYSGVYDFSNKPGFSNQFYVDANGANYNSALAVPTQNAPSLTVPTHDAPALAAGEQEVPGGNDDYGRTLGLSVGLPVGAALAGAALGRIPKA